MSDPNQVALPACLVCGTELAPPKAKFCSLICVHRNDKAKSKQRRYTYKPNFDRDFVPKVKHPVPLGALAEKLGCDLVEAERQARKLAKAKRLRLWLGDGLVTHVGVPVAQEERPAPRTREDREAALRERKRVKNARRKANKRAREQTAA